MALFPGGREEHLAHLNRPTRSYLLKFLEAFTEAAPQILLRLYKIALRRQELPFSKIGERVCVRGVWSARYWSVGVRSV